MRRYGRALALERVRPAWALVARPVVRRPGATSSALFLPVVAHRLVFEPFALAVEGMSTDRSLLERVKAECLRIAPVPEPAWEGAAPSARDDLGADAASWRHPSASHVPAGPSPPADRGDFGALPQPAPRPGNRHRRLAQLRPRRSARLDRLEDLGAHLARFRTTTPSSSASTTRTRRRAWSSSPTTTRRWRCTRPSFRGSRRPTCSGTRRRRRRGRARRARVHRLPRLLGRRRDGAGAAHWVPPRRLSARQIEHRLSTPFDAPRTSSSGRSTSSLRFDARRPRPAASSSSSPTSSAAAAQDVVARARATMGRRAGDRPGSGVGAELPAPLPACSSRSSNPETGRTGSVRLSSAEAHERQRSNEDRLRRLTRGFRRLEFDPVLLDTSEPYEIDMAFIRWATRRRARRFGTR